MNSITGLNWGILEILFIILAGGIGFITTYLIMPALIRHMRRKGHVGQDIHKNAKPKVAESGGLGMVLGWTTTLIFLLPFFPVFFNEILIIISTILLAALIGYVDDRIKLRSRYKILLTVFIGLFIFIANYFKFIKIKDPFLPILGQLRLNIIYPILIPIIVTVFSNTVNMLEGYNGEGSGTCLIAVGFLILASILRNSAQGLLLSIITAPVILAFFIFNKYPAKSFPGDVGTLTMGVMIASIALFGDLLAAAASALLLHISNSFYYISSVGGFFESEEIHKIRDDIILLKDDRISASEQPDALLTLPRLLLSKGPLKEHELVKNFYGLSLFCGCLALITSLLISLTMGALNYIIIIILSLVIFIPMGIILYYFKRIFDMAIQFSLLYIILILVFIIIDLLILPNISGALDLIIIKIPFNILVSLLITTPGLIVWWFFTIRYFWKQIAKLHGKKSNNPPIEK
jgi:UDP-N-acetylglucosamine--dolichyl-phosphate N-acetylglucosaminephosphotransferase